jgi:hypothetical protein
MELGDDPDSRPVPYIREFVRLGLRELGVGDGCADEQKPR